jgi:peptidoglycan/LPS O-acetylase OafA/YrhL
MKSKGEQTIKLPVPKASKRIFELDALRGFAALGVVILHFADRFYVLYFPGKPPLFSFHYAFIGVHLFFIISGFVIFMTLEKTKRLLDFAVSRFSRLFPAYWSCILLTFCAVRLFHLPKCEVSFKTALINLTMLQNWFHVEHVDGVYWTLCIELGFYVLMALLFVTRTIKYIEVFGLFWLLIIISHFNLYAITHFAIPQVIMKTGLIDFGSLFIAGIFFYKIRHNGHTWQRHAVILLCLLTQFTVGSSFLPNHPKAVIFIFLVFYLFILNRLSFLSLAPVLFLGEISYSLYLIHENIGFIILYHGIRNALPEWLLFFTALIVSFCLAILIRFIVEKPVMKYIRDIYKKHFFSPDKSATVLAKGGSHV